MNLAIITARGGSKRIPRKNIRPFCGKPILAYSIQAALDAGCFDAVMVSTDDDEIAAIAQKHGAEVPFRRSAATSNDFATTADVVLEVLQAYRDRGQVPTNFCCLYPTAPFVTAEALREGWNFLQQNAKIPAAFPVVRFSFPIQRALRREEGIMSFREPQFQQSRSQDLEPMYHDAGQFYWCRVAAFLESRNVIMPGTAGILLPESQVQDIDNEDDWLLAEIKYRFLEERKRVTSP